MTNKNIIWMSQKEVDAWRKAEQKVFEEYNNLERSNGFLDAIEKMRKEDLMNLKKQPESPQQPYNQNQQANINSVRRSAMIPSEAIPSSSDGHKESNGKQEFELDWEFIESMAKRMAKNKTKYGRDNWKKPMDIESLKQALFRHVLQVMKGNYNDEEKLDHFDAIALNCMFLKFQIKNHAGLHN